MFTALSSNITRNYNTTDPHLQLVLQAAGKFHYCVQNLQSIGPSSFAWTWLGGFLGTLVLLLFVFFFFLVSSFFLFFGFFCEVFPSVSKCNKILLMVITIFVLRCVAPLLLLLLLFFRFRSVGSSSMCTE